MKYMHQWTWSGNGLSPDRTQDIAWTNTYFIVDLTPRNNFQWNFNQIMNISYEEITFENKFLKWLPFC